MKIIPTALFTAVLLVALTGCGTAGVTTESGGNLTPKLTTGLMVQKNLQLERIMAEYNLLESSSGSILIAAQFNDTENGFCVQYEKFMKYIGLVNDYNVYIEDPSELLVKIKATIQVKGQQLATTAYGVMKANKSLGCGKNERQMVETMASFMDTYGKPADLQEVYEPKVIREAYLRATKAEVQEAIVTFRTNRNGDTESWLYGIVSEAKKKWLITPAELGIPPALQKELELL